jgi:hypothetical protein
VNASRRCGCEVELLSRPINSSSLCLLGEEREQGEVVGDSSLRFRPPIPHFASCRKSGRPQGRVLRECLWFSFTLTITTTITALPYVPYGQPHRNVGDSLGFAHCVRQTVSSDYIDRRAYSSNMDLVYETSFPHISHHCPVMKSDSFFSSLTFILRASACGSLSLTNHRTYSIESDINSSGPAPRI